MDKLKKSFKEVLTSILPMVVLIMILGLTIVPFTAEDWVGFIGGAVMMMLGLTLFLFGADLSMMEVGTRIGSYMVKKRSLAIMIILGFIIGVAITVAEPDVQVLANQVATISSGEVGRVLLIAVVGIGVGIALVVALMRIVFRIPLTTILIIGYILAFILAFFCNPSLMPVSFDSGGVTTGPMTVPFLLALGTGITNMIRPDKSGDDNFGMIGIASIGAVLSVLILGVAFR